jgi:hypothetical protein
MKDESPTLNRITADCVRAQNRYLPDPADIDPHDFGGESSCTVCNRLRLTSFLGDAMAEHGNDGLTLKRQGLYPCEAEIARRLSQSEKHWRRIAPQLERQGLPRIDSVMKGRFWPAVEAFFRNRHGLRSMVAFQPDGEERWDVP